MKQSKLSSETTCPMCGQGKTHIMKIDYKLRDENGKTFTVPELDVEVCDFCGEQIFNMDSVRKARKAHGATNKLLIRLRPEMHAALASSARKSKRSMTQEAHHLLEESLRAANEPTQF